MLSLCPIFTAYAQFAATQHDGRIPLRVECLTPSIILDDPADQRFTLFGRHDSSLPQTSLKWSALRPLLNSRLQQALANQCEPSVAASFGTWAAEEITPDALCRYVPLQDGRVDQQSGPTVSRYHALIKRERDQHVKFQLPIERSSSSSSASSASSASSTAVCPPTEICTESASVSSTSVCPGTVVDFNFEIDVAGASPSAASPCAASQSAGVMTGEAVGGSCSGASGTTKYRYLIMDLNSSNGTWLNGIQLVPLRWHPLVDGARIAHLHPKRFSARFYFGEQEPAAKLKGCSLEDFNKVDGRISMEFIFTNSTRS